MTSRIVVRRAMFVVALLGPVAALGQDVTIEHQEIGCVVAGTFPKVSACFAPAEPTGKARVYFRPETTSTWFYVEMAADAACHSGVLPRPSKALIDKKIFYYVDMQGTGTGRTREYAPVVVAREADCKRLPVAPLSATGPVSVYPSLPTGFLGGGVSTGVVAAGVAAAAVIGGGAILIDGDDTPATTPGSVPVTVPPPTTPSTTVPPTTTAPGPNALALSCEATPRSGEAPLRVEFAAFPSGGTGTYEFLWSFGDGDESPNPNPAHTFLSDGTFNSTVRVVSGDQTATCTRPITVGPPPDPPGLPSPSPSPSPSPTTFRLQVVLVGSGTGTVTSVPAGINCPGDCDETYAPGTVVTLTATPAGSPPTVFDRWTGHCTGTGPCVVTMLSNRNVVAHFERARTLTVQAGANSDIAGSVTSNPAGITCAWAPSAPCTDTATYVNGTTVTLTVVTTGLTVTWGGACTGATGTVCNVLMDADKAATVDTLRLINRDAEHSGSPPIVTSRLDVPDGEGQLVINGTVVAAVRLGTSSAAAEGRIGVNRVEALLVRGAGRPGTWRFAFNRHGAFDPASIRVIAGTVALVGGDAVAFQLAGKPGERIVFTFETQPPEAPEY